MTESVILYPFTGMGHLAPMIQLAKLFARQGFAVTVILSGNAAASMDQLASRVSAANSSISFHHLPCDPAAAGIRTNFFRSMLPYNSSLRDFLRSRSTGSSLRAVVLDFFCSEALDVTAELGLPTYTLFSSGVYDLAVCIYLPKLLSEVRLKDCGEAPVNIPELLPIPATELPAALMEPESEDFKGMTFHLRRLPDADGILINSFESLEPRALKSLRSGVFVPGRSMPAVYCIGPLISENVGHADGEEGKHESIAWLDLQPTGSVIFLCFGSYGTFSGEQIKEIAAGLELSGQRFLWVVKAPKEEIHNPARGQLDLEKVLPEGFMDRTRGRGLAVNSWAPQVEVLRHPAVGGFVSHCGWNSVLESIANGVPLIAWPLYAEQRMNKLFLVEEMKLAVAVEGYEKGLVKAEEVEKKVRWLMGSKEGRELKERMAEAKERAAEAWREGGSSYKSWLEAARILRASS